MEEDVISENYRYRAHSSNRSGESPICAPADGVVGRDRRIRSPVINEQAAGNGRHLEPRQKDWVAEAQFKKEPLVVKRHARRLDIHRATAKATWTTEEEGLFFDTKVFVSSSELIGSLLVAARILGCSVH